MISHVCSDLTPEHLAKVLALASEVTEHDGVSPLSEHVLLRLKGGDDEGSKHVVIVDEDTLLGYAHLDVEEGLAGTPTAELVVSTTARRRGVGGLLVDQLLDATASGGLQLWAHGESAPARHLAETRGFDTVRVLLQMRRSLYAPLPAVEIDPGFNVRTFEVGRDEQEWLALNARAFIDLPDQGSWTLADLQARMKERWFDPESFLLATDPEGRLVGFHWVKFHGPGHTNDTVSMGETYVIGVDPRAQGRRLGRSLMIAGLRLMRAKGLGQAMLYVDLSNTAAHALYKSLGFAQWDIDVLYRRPLVGTR